MKNKNFQFVAMILIASLLTFPIKAGLESLFSRTERRLLRNMAHQGIV